jgi:cytochrome b561
MNEAPTVWPLSLRLAHWLNAALVVGTLGLGAFMVLVVQGAATRFELTQVHKSLGLFVLALTVVRLAMRCLLRAPKPEPVTRSVAIIAAGVQVGLYVLLLALPASGWLMVTSTPVRIPTVVLGLFELPNPLAPDMLRFRLAHGGHIFLAGVLAALVVVHVTAAFVHALLWRDRTLWRMWRRAG